MRKKFTMLLAALLCCVGVVKAQIASLEDLQNDACYLLQGKRGYIAANEGYVMGSNYGTLAGTTVNETNANHQFAILKSGESYYLYNVGAKKFVIKNGTQASLSDTPSHTIEIVAASDQSTDYDWIIKLNGYYINLSNASNNGVYTNCNTEDEGNRWSITLVSDETFSSEAAIAKIEAETSATYVTSIDGFSNDYLYTFISNRSTTDYLMYASSITSDYVVSNYKYSGLSVGHDNEACQWAVYKSDNGYYYMYNVGAGKFMGTATGRDASIPFSETPQTTDLIFKASSVTTHPIMISTNGGDGTLNRSNTYGYGAINWDNDFGNTDDAGNVNKVRQVAEIGAELKATIANLVSAFEKNAVYAELQTLIGEVQTCIDGANQGVGTITTKSANTLSAAVTTAESVTTSNTYSEIVSATTTLQSAYDAAEYIYVTPESGKYYTFASANSNKGNYENALVYAGEDNKLHWSNTKTASDATAVWYYDGSVLKNIHTGWYINGFISNNPSPLAKEGKAATFDYVGKGQMKVTVNGTVMHTQGGGAVVSWASDPIVGSSSAFYINEVDVKELSHFLSVDEAGWASLVLGFNATIPADVTLYTVSSVADGYACLAKVEGNVLPANTPVLVEAAKGNHEFCYSTETVSAIENNLLEGTLFDKNVTDQAYKLSTTTDGDICLGKVSFNISTDTSNDGEDGAEDDTYEAFCNNANEAYLPYTVEEGGTAPEAITFRYEAQIDDVKYLSLADAIAAVSAAATSNPTITLLADITATETIVFDNTVTLNLNGFTVKNTTEKIWAIKVDGNSTLTLTDNTEGAQGTIKAWKGVSVVQGSNLVMNGGNIVTTGATGAAIQVFGSEATMNGGNIKSAYGAILMYSKGDVRGTFTMNDGTINSVSPAIYANGSEEWDDVDVTISGGKIVSETVGVYWPAVGKLTIAGGEIEGKTAVYVKGGSLEITDGTLTGIGEKAEYGFVNSGFNETGDALVIENVASGGYQAVSSVVISGGTFKSTYADAVASYAADGATAVANFIKGGTFSSAVAKEYCAAGFIPTENEDGTCGVKEGVACVEGVGYETLQEAYDAVADGDTITLNADATGAGLVIKKNVTIDFNGKTYTVNSAVGSTGTETLAFQVLAGANAAAYDVTFKNGTIAVTDAVVEGSKALKVVIMNYSNLTLDGMTVDGTGSSAMQYGVATNNGKLTLDGETTIEVADGVCALDVDGSQKYYGAVTAEIGENVTINGDVAIYGEDATVAITQGTFNGDFSIDETAGVTITGGTFANNTDEDVLLHLPLGYQLVQADGEDDFTATNTGESDLVRIVDGAGAYENTADVPVGELRYVRTFGHTDWQVLYVPFAIPVENMNGIEVYSISSVADDVVMVDKVTSGTLAAHTPYLIKANEVGEKTITVEDVTLKAVPETAGKIELDNGYTFTGTYAPMDATALSGSYVLTGVMENEVVTSAQWMQLGAESTAVLGAFRVYLTVPADATEAPALRIATRGETGIENSEFTIQNSAVIYDLTGRRVEKMDKGIYIVNGKKVVIR